VFDSVYLKRSFIFSSSAFAVAFHKRFNAISIDAALAGDDIRGGAGPEKNLVNLCRASPLDNKAFS
jgi:hypothetical protein